MRELLRDGIALDQLSSPALAMTAAFGLGLLFGVIPAGAAEALALAAGAVNPMPLRSAILILLTLGHVLGKAVWYRVGMLGDRVTNPRLRGWVVRARELSEEHERFGVGLMAASAFASIPPFQLTIVAAGVVRSPVSLTLGVAFLGRLARFGLIAASPSALRELLLR
ncbi:MAG: hypothetical protein H7099_07885 [Gemmatimonadaceae bacterium]|nr:hypothetical protein [Gemmatimonadaceae bacterium]